MALVLYRILYGSVGFIKPLTRDKENPKQLRTNHTLFFPIHHNPFETSQKRTKTYQPPKKPVY